MLQRLRDDNGHSFFIEIVIVFMEGALFNVTSWLYELTSAEIVVPGVSMKTSVFAIAVEFLSFCQTFYV